jgi:transposase-like protein
MCEGYSIRQLGDQSGCRPRTLRRIIRYWLARPPVESRDLSGHQYLVIDGTFLQGRQTAVVSIADPTANRIVTGGYGLKEGEARMLTFCERLADQGLHPRSVTIDGNPQLFTMLKVVWPTVIVQRCLVHIQRQGLAWCRRNPKRADARRLRELFLQVMEIHTPVERDSFLAAWNNWERRFGQRIAHSPETGWVFSDLKRARSMLHKALPYMFAYLDDPAIPRTTNWLEGYFSRLKARYRQHRGLPPSQRTQYFQWYFHLCRK